MTTYLHTPEHDTPSPNRLMGHTRRTGYLLGLTLPLALAVFTAGGAFAQMHHTILAAEAEAAPSSTNQTILGEVIPFGQGTARSWVQVDGSGKPATVGITLTEAALEGLPAEVTPGLIWMVEYILAMPSDVGQLPFNHIGVNWNPRGHDPHGIYGVPHFDFHFYTISPEQRSQITARGDDLAKCNKVPVAGRVAEGYIFAPASEEPGMGGHWIDPVSHEFHGQSFTSTFIYGTYDGEVIFYEPMITMAYLQTKPDAITPIKVPTSYAQAGYYPTSYRVHYDAKRKEYTVSLEGLTLRQAASL